MICEMFKTAPLLNIQYSIFSTMGFGPFGILPPALPEIKMQEMFDFWGNMDII